MTDHTVHGPVAPLDQPVMVMMLSGWIDASAAAAAAMDTLVEQSEATGLVTFDDDVYIDYRARRPVMELREGLNRRLVWSVPELNRGRDQAGRSTCACSPGPSPTWRGTASPPRWPSSRRAST